MNRHFDDSGNVLDGEYPVRVHRGDSGGLFCSLVNEDGESIIPGNIEYIEGELFNEELPDTDVRFEEFFSPESTRNQLHLDIGMAIYEDGVMKNLHFDMFAVDSLEE